MAFRTLVTGSDMCSGSDGAGPSNAVGALVNQLLGGAAKTQEQLRDLPVHHAMPPLQQVPLSAEAAAAAAAAGPSGIFVPGMPLTSMAPQHLDAWLAGPGPRIAHDAAVADMAPMGPQLPGMPGQMPLGAPPAVAQNIKAFLSGAAARGALPP